QHEEPVVNRPADQVGDHFAAREIAVISNGPSFDWRNSKLTVSPTLRSLGRPLGGGLKPMVIAGHCSEAIGPCERITSSLSIFSTLAVPLCVEPASGSAPGCASPMRVVAPLRLDSESMRNWPDTTTFWPASRPLRM